jgi:hypothetical protein
MVADVLGSLSLVSDDSAFADTFDFAAVDDLANDNQMIDDEERPAFVRGSVLDACVAHDRVGRMPASSHIAAIDSDDNGLYRLFRTR